MNNELCVRCDSEMVAEHGMCVACLEETLADRTLIADTLRQKKLGVLDDQQAADIFYILARERIPVTRYVEMILEDEEI